jgi:outer membrane receptor protein involved in Fe transport
MNVKSSGYINYRKLYFISLFFSLSTVIPAARISGIVKDSKKNILAEVTVIVKHTDNTTSTDTQGKFKVTVPDEWETAVLIFQRKGYHPRELRVKVDNKPKILEMFFIPREYLLEKVTVTAMNQERESIEVPAAERSLSSLEIQEKIPESIVDTLSDTPGVHFIGSGGLAITPSIRGLARRRVLVLVDGHRITSDRRAGTSPSFVPPELADRIEVVRSASSVLYGSDAIGGVVNILTRPTQTPESKLEKNTNFNLGFNPNNNWINTGINTYRQWEKWKIFSGFQFNRADDYNSPEGKMFHAGYTYYSGKVDLSFADKNRAFYLGYIGGIGKDIGKPDRKNNPDKYDLVPTETNHIIRLGYTDKQLVKKGTFDFSLFLNPNTYLLDKIDTKANTIQGSNTTGLNLGIKSDIKKSLSSTFALRVGAEWFSRQGVDMENRAQTRNEIIEVTYPLRSGTRNDYGLFFTFDYSLAPSLEIDGGIRCTYFSIRADVNGRDMEKSTGSPSLFLGIIKKFNSGTSIFINLGRAFRFPSLSEAFYTGITGRNYVIGNPDLEPESSWNIDAGLKIASKKFAMGLYLFTNHIRDMIERYRNEDDIYTYDNIDAGRIYGGEIELEYHPFNNFELFGHFFYYKGKSTTTDEPLNDLPAPRLALGGKFFVDRFWFQLDFLHSLKKTNPGPAEVENDAFTTLDIKGGIYFSSAFSLYVKVSNLFNQLYYPNADPDIPPAKGLNITAGLHFYF